MNLLDLLEEKKLGLTIFDIDETLMRTTAKIKVVKNGREVRSLTNQEFNSYQLKPGEEYDFGEFRNAEKFQKESEPIGPMIAKLKAILNNAGDSKVIMLTARADFDDKETFLDTFRKLGIDMNRVHVHRAGNLGGSPAASKAVWIRKYLDTGKYGRVRLYDDAVSNIKMFNALAKEYPDIEFFPYLVTHDGRVKTVRETTTEAFDTEAEWILDYEDGPIKVFATKVDDAYIELTYKLMTNGDLYIAFSRGGRSSVTGEGTQMKIFGAVINHIKSYTAKTKPQRLVFSAFKPNTGPFGTQDATRSVLYQRMVQRFAGQNGYDFEKQDTGSEDTFILTRRDSANKTERYTPLEQAILEGGHSLEETAVKTKIKHEISIYNTLINEKYKHGDYARGGKPMPKAKKGRTRHPLHGKLVG
jgi:hypothetical protein